METGAQSRAGFAGGASAAGAAVQPCPQLAAYVACACSPYRAMELTPVLGKPSGLLLLLVPAALGSAAVIWDLPMTPDSASDGLDRPWTPEELEQAATRADEPLEQSAAPAEGPEAELSAVLELETSNFPPRKGDKQYLIDRP